ncbi:hypothetical protein HPP92_010883 [Vanilla planifolia]|uniref:AP2/ERF domain-containing protein n=1 Tax=Vanilla planifolia TaxID=51239 RepID=A0A835V0I4_VANPL|nr:hypothetical protein HPP92_011158 [Vanilla planifolia]KAG0482799.1 hypothetical protein HPP92_010883 [Vanilla planifolia]
MAKTNSPTTSGVCAAGNLHPNHRKQRQYKGVRMRSWGSWVSEIRAPSQKTRIWLGSYSTPEAAARAYDAALLCLKGSSASLNFPLSSPHLPPCALSSPKTIQRIAAAAAAASPPPDSPSSASSSVAIENPAAVTSPTSATEELTEFGAFLSPTCFLDLMANPFDVFVAPWTEETNETGDLKLWSFC